MPLDCHPYGVSPCRDANGNALPGGYPVGGAPYPADKSGLGTWENNGTSQPKVTLRFDQELGQGGANGRITYEGGYAGTEGIIHTGIGPFDIQNDSYMAYGKAVYTKGALRVGAFANFVDANATNLILPDPPPASGSCSASRPPTYDLEVGNSNVLGGKHILTYGANYRRNNFDITLAPGAEDRNDFGAYLQEEFYVDKFRVAVGGRADRADNLDHWFFSPRVSVMWKPTPDQSLRASYNRAFRAPSVINNYLDQNIFSPSTVDLRPLAPLAPPALRPLIPQEPFYLIVNNFGNPNLKEEHVDAFELAYTATIGRTSFGLAVYQNDTSNNINFTTLLPDTENPQGLPGLEYYSVQNPAQGVGAVTGQPLTDPLTGNPGLSPFVMAALAQVPPAFGGPVRLPWKVATYLNLGPLRNRGFEASIEHRVNNEWVLSGNYSYQADPKVLDAERGRDPLPDRGGRRAAEEPVQRRRELQRPALPRQRQRQLRRACVLERRARRRRTTGYTDAYTLLNATARHQVRRRQGAAQPARDQPPEPGDPAAHLRRPDAHLGDGGAALLHALSRRRRKMAPGPLGRGPFLFREVLDVRRAGRGRRHRVELGARDGLPAGGRRPPAHPRRQPRLRCASRAGSTTPGAFPTRRSSAPSRRCATSGRSPTARASAASSRPGRRPCATRRTGLRSSGACGASWASRSASSPAWRRPATASSARSAASRWTTGPSSTSAAAACR